MKKIFVVDWILLPYFFLTAITGIGMHIAGHGTNHLSWEIWAWGHSLTLIGIIITITGVVMFVVSGANSGVGLWHYRIGILFSLFAIGHIIKRIPILRKSLNK